MNRYQTLHASADFALRVFDHPELVGHEDPDREVASGWGLAFVRQGHFSITVDGRRRDLQAGSLFITHPGLEFRCQHTDGCADDVCVSIAFNEGAVRGFEDAWTRSSWAARELPTPQLAFVQHRLESALARNDDFNVERWAHTALDALSSDTTNATARGSYALRGDDIAAVIATCEAVDRDPVARQSIADRAQSVQRSGTQLTHAFRRFLGVSPHQYVVRRRIAVAADLLAAGRSVSDACYLSGFENLSHFVRSFQRTLGVRASQWTALSSAERRRKVQDLLRRRS